jgi:excisionase family DNA binding protein
LGAEGVTRKWFSVAEVADMLGFGLSKTKMLVITGQIRSVKHGRHRRVRPEWVDEFIDRVTEESVA